MAKVPTGAEWLKMNESQRRRFSLVGQKIGSATPQPKYVHVHKPKPLPHHLICKYGEIATPSEPENRIRATLNTFPFEFYAEVSFKGFMTPKYQYYRFDFYIPSLRIVIEYDGAEHRLPEQKKIDRIKEGFCKRNGLKVVRYNRKNWLTLEEDVIKILSKYKY